MDTCRLCTWPQGPGLFSVRPKNSSNSPSSEGILLIDDNILSEIEGHRHRLEVQGHPTSIFGKYLFGLDDLKSRIFGTFVVKFLACLSSLIVPRVKFEPESSSSHESNFPFFLNSFVFNCCVKIMYQRYEDSKILLFFLFVYFSLPITTVYSCINLVRSCFSKK